MINFTKSQALSNDFIIIDDLEEVLELAGDTIARLCDRHFGIGADGLILTRPSSQANYFMKFFNPNGTEAEMCGNGIRCFARHLYDCKLVARTDVYIETLAGIKEVKIIFDDGEPRLSQVDMGEPSFRPLDFHVLSSDKEMIDYPLETEKGTVKATCLSMGNPHCVIFTENVDEVPIQILGPMIEKLPIFQKKTNVEFVQIVSPDKIKTRIWERGAGVTLACGTGACAAVAAAVKKRLTGRNVKVCLPGGLLEIEWASNEHVFLTGPAEEVFAGAFDLDKFA